MDYVLYCSSTGEEHPWKFYNSSSPNMDIPSQYNPNNPLTYSDYYQLGFLPHTNMDVQNETGLVLGGEGESCKETRLTL